jgi:hypothetical protein
VIVGVAGVGFTITAVDELEAEQPLVVIVTVYDPELNTVIACVVAPFDHIYVPPGEDVSITESPKQKVVGPLGVIVGGAGVVLTVTAVGALVALQPLVVTVTV